MGEWIRTEDWLAMPAIGTQEFIGLLAITDDEMNHIALLCAGAYTVDWGDGVIENFATNVKAQHTYAYSSISDNTISSRGYKQVLVRVTPQAGQNLTKIDINQRNSLINKNHVTGWLDIYINGSNITALSLNVTGNGNSLVNHGLCERVNIGNIGIITSFVYLFSNLYSLQSVSLFNTSQGVSFWAMFAGCNSLRSVPLFDFSKATTLDRMFSGCVSLKSVPKFNTGNNRNFTTMFQNCRSLKSVPLFDTGKGTTFNSMFSGCTALRTVPLLNTALGTDLGGMFSGCTALRTAPLLNTSSATSFDSMFSSCMSLQSVPLLDTGKATSLNSMFYNCFMLQSAPLLNTSLVTNFTSMFYGCYSLQSIPLLNTAAGTGFNTMFSGASSVAKAKLQGTRYSISYSGLSLSKSEVLSIFAGLGTASGTASGTITISGNPAVSAKSLNLTILGWRGAAVVASTQDVYVSAQSSYIYKQTGGTGPFVIDSVYDGAYRGMGTDIYNNVYCAKGSTLFKKTGGSGPWTNVPTTGADNPSSVAGDFLGNLYVGTTTGLYRQTGLTGSFSKVYTGNVGSFDISSFDGSIYVTDAAATGTIYKQTAGTGSFSAIQNIPWGSICCVPSGDVYVSSGSLYKQTAGTGSFVSIGIVTGNGGQIVDKADGTFYSVGYLTEVYYLDFNKVIMPEDRLIATSKGWTIAL